MNKSLKQAIRRFLPRSLAPHRILGGPLSGMSIITSWHDYPAAILGRTELPLLNWFAANAATGSTWLDIGAHYGYTALALSRCVGPSGHVFAFEPMAATAGCVARTRERNGIGQLTVVPIALNDFPDLQVQRLPQVRGMVDSTLGDNAGGETFLTAGLDWLWPRIRGTRSRVDGVKVDVQGMELHVLRGMMEILREHRPKLVVELHKGVSREDFRSLLASAGYTRPGISIDSQHEVSGIYADDCSYAFTPDAQ